MSGTTPANNGPLPIDHKVVAGTMFSVLSGLTDYAADFQGEFQAPINGQRTSSVLIRLKPSLVLAAMPATRDGLLPRTGISGGTVEIGLKSDSYFKVAVDDQGVLPGQVETEVGTAGAEAIVREGNRDLVETLEADGTAVAFGSTFGASTKADAVWAALLNQVVAFQEADITSDFVLYIRPAVWARLISDIASLRTSVDAQGTAAALLGVRAVRVVNLADSLAVFAHRGAVAQAKVLSGIRSAQEDFDSIVEGRIKVGTTVLEPAAVRVLVDGQ